MTTNTLTDRYVDATLRRLPERQRPDIERELRASIADAVDDRVEAGAKPDEAERSVLTDLGDPARLAAGYADRPLHLIGPALFLDYTRLMVALLGIVIPAVAGAVGIARLAQGAEVLSAIGSAVTTAWTTAVHLVFWTTVVFVVIERTSKTATVARPWTPDALPEPTTRRARYGELIAESVFAVLFSAFLLLSPRFSTERDANGDPISVLAPSLWDNGVIYIYIAIVVASVGYAFGKYYLRWNAALAVAGTLVGLAGAGLLVWLGANDRVVNPAFATAAGWPEAVSQWIHAGLVIVGVLSAGKLVIDLVVGISTRSWRTPDLNRLINNVVDGLTRTRRP
jgi:hypothetical protein